MTDRKEQNGEVNGRENLTAGQEGGKEKLREKCMYYRACALISLHFVSFRAIQSLLFSVTAL